MSHQLIQAIGVQKLTEYFEFLNELRESGATNMYGAGAYLQREYPGMAREETRVVLGAWMKHFSNSKPAEDCAMDAIEGVVA